jgi:hypothetical protein
MVNKAILLSLLITATGFFGPISVFAQTNTPSKQTQARDKQVQQSLETLPTDNPGGRTDSLSVRQKLSIAQTNLAKAQTDAAELAILAKELREELNKPGINILSLEVLNRAEKIGKLAKKIREETRVY